ncbi:MAG: helix-turn-helix transcriptional regulator [Parvibaculum sp.]|uniref:helix-turn-helix domain-containing protein n=1 Tax=Parvibaculum sp. TaxID=2024848 RepID=UPI0032EC9DEF
MACATARRRASRRKWTSRPPISAFVRSAPRPFPDAASRDPFQRTTSRLSAAGQKASLTSRELQVLECLAEGQSNKVIAANLSITGDTVKAHLKSLYDKLGASDRALIRVVPPRLPAADPCPEAGEDAAGRPKALRGAFRRRFGAPWKAKEDDFTRGPRHQSRRRRAASPPVSPASTAPSVW